MTTTTAVPASEAPGAPGGQPTPSAAAVLWSAVRAEALKLRTVRSTVATVVLAVLLAIALGAGISAAVSSSYTRMAPAERATFDPTNISLAGLSLAQLALGVLGVMAIGGEYSTGSIRAAVAAVPWRGTLAAAKAIVLAVTSFVVGVLAVFPSFFLGQLLLRSPAPHASIGDPGVFRAVIGAALYLMAVTLLGFTLGLLLRSTAAGISVLVVLLLILPIITSLLPKGFRDSVGEYLPANAGTAVTSVRQQLHTLTPWVGFGVFCAWVAVIGALAVVRLRRSDI
jgi:ABC-2 type transport system permease protein